MDRRPTCSLAALALTGAVAAALPWLGPAAPAGADDGRTPVTSGAQLVSAFGSVPATIGPRDLPDLAVGRSVSNDGRFVVFTSPDQGSGDKNGVVDVYVRDRSDGSTDLVSQLAGHAVGGRAASLGPDGRYLAFVTAAALVPGDSGGGDDLYVLDRRTGTMRLGNRAIGGPAGLPVGSRAQVSNDGTTVAWVGTDPATTAVRRLDTGTTMAVPTPGGDLRGIQLSGTGRHLLVMSNGLAWRVDTTTGTHHVVSDPAMVPAISACEGSISYDGTRVVVSACAGGLYRWDAASPTARPAIPTTGTGVAGWLSLSGDGRFVTYELIDNVDDRFRLIDLADGTGRDLVGGIDPVSYAPPTLPAIPEISGDGMVQVVTSRSTVAGQAEAVGTRQWAISGATVPATSITSWTKGLYQSVLGRTPTTAESGATAEALGLLRRTAPQVVQDLLHTPAFANPRAPMVRLYQAFFLRAPDRSGYEYWVSRRLGGRTLNRIASQFAGSSEFVGRYGTLTNRQFVDLVYANVLGRPGDAGGVASWTRKLDEGTKTRGEVMVGFSESGEYVRATATQVDFILGTYVATGTVPTPAQLVAASTRWAAGVSVTSDLRDLFGIR